MCVSEKQRIINKAIMTTKMKLARVSKPSQLAKSANGPGKMAITMKAMGSKSQATEFLMDIELRLRERTMMISRIIAAMAISTCKLDMTILSEINDYD